VGQVGQVVDDFAIATASSPVGISENRRSV
jgi:hypothetical protein